MSITPNCWNNTQDTESYVAKIAYNISESRDILINQEENANGSWTFGRENSIPQGSGTIEISFSVNLAVAPVTLVVHLLPRGVWDTTQSLSQSEFVLESCFTPTPTVDTIEILSITPNCWNNTQDTESYVAKIAYNISETRDILINQEENANGLWTFGRENSIPQGSGTIEISFSVNLAVAPVTLVVHLLPRGVWDTTQFLSQSEFVLESCFTPTPTPVQTPTPTPTLTPTSTPTPTQTTTKTSQIDTIGCISKEVNVNIVSQSGK